MSARDRDTGAEQSITISETSNLDKAEVDRMIADAERYQAEDARIRQEVDARNELDAVAHQVERQLPPSAISVPVHERARAEMLVADARQAVKESAPLDRLRSLTGGTAADLPRPGGTPAGGAAPKPAGRSGARAARPRTTT